MDNPTETKVVTYLGQIYEVPLWAAYIAKDYDSSIYVYENEPVEDDGYFLSVGGKYKWIVDAPLLCQAI